jgi:hypothetical protein
LVRAQELELVLKVAEGSQAVMLLRKPAMKVVHVSLFEIVEEATGLYSWPARRAMAVIAFPPCPPRRPSFGGAPLGREPGMSIEKTLTLS